MSSLQDKVKHYLNEFDEGKADNSFHCLTEAGGDVVPILIEAYNATVDIDKKVFLLDVISEYRLDSCLQLLGDSLQYNEDILWQTGLDGLMKSNSWLVPDIIEKAVQSAVSELKINWLQEAKTAKIAELR